jgi:hypothetical protein
VRRNSHGESSEERNNNGCKDKAHGCDRESGCATVF